MRSLILVNSFHFTSYESHHSLRFYPFSQWGLFSCAPSLLRAPQCRWYLSESSAFLLHPRASMLKGSFMSQTEGHYPNQRNLSGLGSLQSQASLEQGDMLQVATFELAEQLKCVHLRPVYSTSSTFCLKRTIFSTMENLRMGVGEIMQNGRKWPGIAVF